MAHLLARVRRRRGRTSRPAAPCRISPAYDDLYDDLPDEDLAEDLSESLDLYVHGSKPRCEEAEYLELMQDAIERIAHER